MQVLAGELAVHRDLAPEEQLGVATRDEADQEGTELVSPVGDDLNGELGEPVQAHETRERGGSESLRPETTSESRCVDRVVEVRVADEDPGHLPRRPEVAADQRFVKAGPFVARAVPEAAPATRTGR